MGAGVVEVANDVGKVGELAFRHGINRRTLRCCFAVLQDIGIVLQGNGGGHGVFRVEFRVEVIQGLSRKWLVVQRGRIPLSLIGGDSCLVHIRIGGNQLWGNA